MQHARAIVGFLFLFHTLNAAAYEARFEIDKTLKITDLERTGKPVARTVRQGDIYRSDSSAVLSKVDFEKLSAASADFNRYKEMGMPNVLASRTVSQTGDLLYTWTHMSTAGQESRHFLEVRLMKGLTPGGASGSQWQLVRKQAGWTDPDQPAFKRLDGSWYMEPLPNGKVYVRYFLAVDVDSGIPDFIVDLVAKQAFTDGVKRVIEVLARQAAVGH